MNKVIYFILIAAAVFPSLSKIVLSDLLFCRKDTRTVTREWFEQSVPIGAKVALDSPFYMPRLKPMVKQLVQKREDLLTSNVHQKARLLRLDALIKESKKNGEPGYQLYFLKAKNSVSGFLFSKPEVPYDFSALKRRSIEYVVVSQINDESKPFFNTLNQNANLVARFTPYRNQSLEYLLDMQPLTGGPFLWKDLLARERNGPIVSIYKLKS